MIRQWFENLSNRDQLLLMGFFAVFGIWLFVQLVFFGLDAKRAQLFENNIALQSQLNRVDAKVEQLRVLRSRGGIEQINVSRTLSLASERQGLKLERLQPNSRGEVQIRFEGVPSDSFLRFLEQIEAFSGLVVIDASINRANRGGTLNATLRVAAS